MYGSDYEVTSSATSYAVRWPTMKALPLKSSSTFTAWTMRVKSALAPFPVFVSLIGGDHVAPGQEEVEVAFDFEGRVQAVLDNRGYFVPDSYEAKGFEVTQTGFGTTALSPIKVSHRAERVALGKLH